MVDPIGEEDSLILGERLPRRLPCRSWANRQRMITRDLANVRVIMGRVQHRPKFFEIGLVEVKTGRVAGDVPFVTAQFEVVGDESGVAESLLRC